MCKRETIVELTAMYRSAFPNYNPEESAMNVLYSFLSDISDETLIVAARACISEPHRAFAPSIGELRGKVVDLAKRAAGIPSTSEAWEMITTQRPTRYYHTCPTGVDIKQQAQDAKDAKSYGVYLHQYRLHTESCQECGWTIENPAIPEIVQRVAKRLGWPETFPSPLNIEVDRAHFFRSYDDAVSKATAHAAEPADVHRFIEANQAAAIKTLAAGMRK